MQGFVTLAVGEAYLQRAAAFALSARRFDLPTILMYRDVDPGPYQSLFAETVDLSREPTVNRSPIHQARELKKCAYRCSGSLAQGAFVDADSLVVRDPHPMFDALAREDVHTPCARNVRDDEHWAAGRITTRAAARAMGVPDVTGIPTLNGGFFCWRRGETAQRVLGDYESLFERLSARLTTSSGPQAVNDELCLAISLALHGVRPFKSDSSIGVWDAGNLVLDIERQQFECTKGYYWEGHRFQPYIAHFGGARISPVYRRSVEFLCRDQNWRIPLFDRHEVSPQTSIRPNAYALTDGELDVLADFVRRNGVRSVLEFGPGRSTECFLNAGCDVWSFEYQERWLEHYRTLLGGDSRLKLDRFDNTADVQLPRIAGRRFDLAFVDAPVGTHRPAGSAPSRLNTALAAARHSNLILLHDVNRRAERATVEVLCARGWQWRQMPGAPKFAILTRNGNYCTDRHVQRPCDFSHWPSLPRVSCQCITYGRTTLLDEAVESFLRQDYPGEKELVILNDLPALKLHFDHPDVRVINLPYRMRSIGEKRNACVALCTGEIIFGWDDDDISLPHRISWSLTRMKNHRYYKADRCWYWGAGEIRGAPRAAVCHAMGCWSVEFFDQVGGYPHIQSGQDMQLEERFKGPDRHVEPIEACDVYYIYRFPGTGSYHLSASGFGKGYLEAARFVERTATAMCGEYEITPGWRQDYELMVARAIGMETPVRND